jgi:peptide/nickel transport system permease protein
MANTLTKAHSIKKKLWQSPTAVFGLSIIAMAVCIAIFAYPLAPDDSPNANFQTVELQARQPGYQQWFLKIPQQATNRSTAISRFFLGYPAQNKLVPINSYWLAGDSLVVQKYIDADTAVRQAYALPPGMPKNSATIKQHFVQKTYWLGTDKFGRDILSRMLIGTRVSLTVGIIAVVISLTIGIGLGAIAGYFGGKTDAAVMWLVNITWSIPTLLLVFAITMALGKGFWQIFIGVGLTLWVSVARLVRGQVMAVKQLEYVQAAKALGFTHTRIIVKHILPNIIGPVMVIAAGNFATAIILEAGLSFLGIGVQPPQPSWGLMIKEHYNFIITSKPLLALLPGIAIMLLVLAFNLVGNALRDAADVRT